MFKPFFLFNESQMFFSADVTVHDVGTLGCPNMLSSGCRSRGFPVLKWLFRWRRQLGQFENLGCRCSSASVSCHWLCLQVPGFDQSQFPVWCSSPSHWVPDSGPDPRCTCQANVLWLGGQIQWKEFWHWCLWNSPFWSKHLKIKQTLH